MRRLLCALAVLGAACSGGPSVPSQTYPNLLGGWTGTMDVSLIQNGVSNANNQCGVTWVVQSQNGGDFTGQFQAAPNAVTVAPCAPLTSFSGKFSNIGPPDLQPTHFDVVAFPADTPPGCTLISQTPLHGFWSQYENAFLISLLGSNQFQCGTLSPVQSIRFTLERR